MISKKIRREATFNGAGGSPADYDDSLFQKTNLGNFLDGFNADIGTNYYFDVDHAAAAAAFFALNPGVIDPTDGAACCDAGDIDSNERVYETLDSVFLQVEMDTQIGSMPLDIVAGLRYETADTESVSCSIR